MTMKVLVLVISLGVALARPDVSHLNNAGYHYHSPSNNAGYEYKPPTNNNAGYQYRPPTNSYGVPIDHSHGDSSSSHQHHHQVPSGSYLPGNLQLPLADSHVNFLSGSSGNNQDHYGYNNHLIQDQKHVYYYAAPDEEEQTRLRIHIAPNNQKNTNVIFVKAPSYGPVIPEVIAPQSQAEEKTKVFVLVKKPEQPAPISIQAPGSVKTRPEVYVVKYNNQYEAEQAISGGRGGHPLGANVHNIGDESTFIKTLESEPSHNVPHNDKYSGFDGNVNAFAGKGLYGAPAVGGGQTFTARGNFGGDDSVGSTGVGSGSVDFSSSHSDSGKASSFDLGSPVGGSGSVGFSTINTDSGKGSTFELGSSGSQGGNLGVSSGSGSVEFSTIHTDSDQGSSIDLGSRSQVGSILNAGPVEGSSLLGSTTGGSGSSGGSGSVEFSVSSSGKGDGIGSQIGSSLDTLKVGSGSGSTFGSSSSSGSDSGSSTFGLRGNFVGGEGSSVSSSFGVPSGVSHTSSFEISSSSSKDGQQFNSPLLTSLTSGDHGSSSSTFEISGSKSSDSSVGSVGVRHGDSSGDASSGSFLVKSTGHAVYGPPGTSGPY